MESLIITFKETIIQFLDIIIILFAAPLATLGIVFMSGRMLSILNRNRPKNILAIVMVFFIHYVYTRFPLITNFLTDMNVKEYVSLWHRVWTIFIRGSVSISLYVLVFWRLYDRFNKLLDKKVGEDNDANYKDPPKRRRRK